MKTKITILLIALLSITTITFAQETNNSHLEFMSIPIDGNVDSFSKSLATKGFIKNISLSSDNALMMTGKFTNREVAVGLISSEKTNNIYRVGVLYEAQTSWELLANHYDYLLELFSKKYGTPAETIKELDSTYDDSYQLMGFNLGKSKYLTYWTLSNGSIQLFISSVSIDSAMITIIYEDAIGAQSLSDESLNDI